MHLFFIEGRDIGDRAELVEIARQHGMDGDLVARLLAEDADVDAVRDDIAMAQNLGVNGVPFFILARQLGVSGAQTPDVLRSAILEALALPPQPAAVSAR